jgi:hypothetical protein
MTTVTIPIQRDIIEMQCKGLTDLFIYLDFTKNTTQLYCSDEKSEEKKVKLNLIKIAKKYDFVKSEKDFWNRIRDIRIKLNKEKTQYDLIYELD